MIIPFLDPLYRLAQKEYQEARGTTHKHLLQRALQQYRQARQNADRSIHNLKNELTVLHQQQEIKFRRLLAQHLVTTRLQEIHGIGPKRSAIIQKRVFRDRLTDLYRARELPEITPEIQAGINKWIHHYESQFSTLLQGDFPGKDAIKVAYEQQLKERQEKIKKAQESTHLFASKEAKINEELNWLNQVRSKDFYQALRNPTQSNKKTDRYMQGVFAEWEPIPDWFREILSEMPATLTSGTTYGTLSTNSQLVLGEKNLGGIALILVVLLFCGWWSSSLNITPATITPTKQIVRTIAPLATTTWTLTPSPTDTPTRIPTVIFSRTPQQTATFQPLPTSTSRPRVQVLLGNVYIRQEPSTDSPILTTVPQGTILTVLDLNTEGSWLLVELPDESTGWVGRNVVTDNISPTATMTTPN